MNPLLPERQSAIILAGRRADRPEPLARAHCVSDKCLVPVGGLPLIEHVAGTLSPSPWIDRIIVSVNEPNLLKDLPVCGALIASGRMLALPSKGNLADSVIDAASRLATPVLITTADNVLLTHHAIATVVQQGQARGADAAVAFARKADILAAHPDGQRRFYEFRDDGYSNCNCYWLGNEAALKAAEVFRSGGQFAKNPLRIASVFGLFNLIRFRFGFGTLAESLQRISKRMGLWVTPVVMDDGALAIDVDNERTHRVVAEILDRRQQGRLA
mgnify:CR=1 FL=1